MISKFGFARVCACDGECSCMFCIVCIVILTEIDFSAKSVCRNYVLFCLNYYFFRSVCRASFTCMLYPYVLGVRMHILGVYVLHCFCVLTEILSSAENFFSAEYVCMYIFCFTFVFICFSFCLSRVLYVHVVQGVCSRCAHVCSWCAHVMVSVAASFTLILHVG